MTWAGKKVLVTGASGFIGSHLVEELSQAGAEVRAFVRYNGRREYGHLDTIKAEIRSAIDVRTGDICDTFSVAAAVEGCEVVFHLAALISIPYSYVAPASYVSTNIVGTLNILEACRKFGVAKVVQTSTSEVYGTAQYTPMDEAHPLQAQSPYAASKIGADKLAESYYRSFGLPVVVVRPFNTYGPRQSMRAVIPTIVAQAMASSVVHLGNLTPIRDMNFVKDVVRGFVRVAATGTAGAAFNLSSGYGISVGDLARRIVALMGSSAFIEGKDEERMRPVNSEVFTLIGDSTAVRQQCHWEPRVSLDEGLMETIEYVRSNLVNYRPHVYVV